jgi:hypothetical protein
MEDEKKKQLYYHTVSVKHIDLEKGQQEFDKLTSEYEMTHDVEHRTSMMTYAAGSYVFAMVFCCEVEEGGINPYYR